MDQYQHFIATSKYCRWIPELGRRERWDEAVARYINFFREHHASRGIKIDNATYDELQAAIINLEVLPSMRAIMTAGPALKGTNVAAYNCGFTAVDSPRAFDEAMYLLMCSTGVGYSVEQRYTSQLPSIPAPMVSANVEIVVEDSREGWATAFRELLSYLWSGRVPTWDVSKVRPEGERLKTFGGRASGPAPLVRLFEFAVDIFANAGGRQLTPLECSDLMCCIGDIVVSGGVRRSALICLSDLHDQQMAMAKHGKWWEQQPVRRLANISSAYNTKPSREVFDNEWNILRTSGSGERGIFNLEGGRQHAALNGRDKSYLIQGANPCGEILLRSGQFCNLSEIVVRAEDSLSDLMRKAALAAILGTWQSDLTDFPYLRDIWKQNTEEERLLGVSLTGIYGHRLMNKPSRELSRMLEYMRQQVIDTNIEWAQILGINPSVALTCVKPSGTVSQLAGVSSGMHPWHSKNYLRSVRSTNNDPITKLMKDYGVPNEPDAMAPDTTTVFYFPISAPDGAITRHVVSAIEQLELWLLYKEHWTDHNPSVTINVADDEWDEVAEWVWRNWDAVVGVSFLPKFEHTYQQAPYQDITRTEYLQAVAEMPKVDWDQIAFYEHEDTTSGSKELACTSGACEVVDNT
jgi:ribonucleoside-triphosphate reductase (thioredoxin)